MAKDNGEMIAATDASHSSDVPTGSAVIPTDGFDNPGFPPHRERVTDLNPKNERASQRVVFTLFYLSIVGSVWAIAAYMLFPIESYNIADVRLNNLFIGIGSALALLGIGIGAVHWGKALMADKEGIDYRHPVRGTDETRAAAVQVFTDADAESGFSRRTMVRNSLIGALIAFPLPAVVLFRGLAPQDQNPVVNLSHTMWGEGVRLARDPSGDLLKAADVTIGSAFHIIPEGLVDLPHGEMLDQKARASVLLVRVDPDVLVETEARKDWSYDGIVAYSKICTHVGCPVALYEQNTHHLLCPCHQSQFDVTDECKVIFGPAARPLPQLPITVDDEGYLVARSDFTEPVGPSFWERNA